MRYVWKINYHNISAELSNKIARYIYIYIFTEEIEGVSKVFNPGCKLTEHHMMNYIRYNLPLLQIDFLISRKEILFSPNVVL